MPFLNIYSLDDTEQQNVIACLPEGKHVIGRGGILHVTDKRVSRKHAVIEVFNDKITLTSIHMNPCFFKAHNGRNLTVIKQNEENELNDGDQFALLPEDYWFRVKVEKNGTDEAPQVNGKRTAEADMMEDAELKRARIEDEPSISHINNPSTAAEQEELVTSPHCNASSTVEHPDSSIHDTLNASQETREEVLNSPIHFQETQRLESVIKEEPLEKSVNDPADDEMEPVNIKAEPEDNVPSTSGDVKAEPPDNNPDNPSTTANIVPQAAPRREKCWYGAACYRKNPNHRVTFSHPGDLDCGSDPDDDPPECPYGAACYRQNPSHRRHYKHTAGPAPQPRPQTPNSPPKKRKAAKKDKPQPDYESDDDYDYNDPFINDDSSDDFDPGDLETESSDTEWQDSQETPEESQERKRMLREAKKFTRKKKND